MKSTSHQRKKTISLQVAQEKAPVSELNELPPPVVEEVAPAVQEDAAETPAEAQEAQEAVVEVAPIEEVAEVPAIAAQEAPVQAAAQPATAAVETAPKSKEDPFLASYHLTRYRHQF